MVEEYDLLTSEIQLRKYRSKTNLGGWSEWAVDIGDSTNKPIEESNTNTMMMKESSANVSRNALLLFSIYLSLSIYPS
jgi:hypothetical protein